MSEVRTRTIIVANRQGLHLRPAYALAELAKRFRSRIRLVKEDREANVSSLLDVMTLGAACGARLSLVAEGDDAELAIEALAALLEKDFDAPEGP